MQTRMNHKMDRCLRGSCGKKVLEYGMPMDLKKKTYLIEEHSECHISHVHGELGTKSFIDIHRQYDCGSGFHV